MPHFSKKWQITTWLLLLWLAKISLVAAQPEARNWYIGAQAGLSFATGTPVALTNGALTSYEACATLSDKQGMLLAYTNGETIWDRTHQVMPNGSSGLGGHNSASQGAVLLPAPNNEQRIYLFCVDAIDNNLVGGLRYSVIDLSLHGGLGDVATKGVALPTPMVGGKVTEKLTAVRHANGRDYWIVVHGWQSNAFYSFLLSPTGVSAMPVVSSIGSVHQGGGSFFGAGNAVGCMKAAPDGHHLALAQRDNLTELFDFDNATGGVSNYVSLGSYYYNYGIEFSPDNSRLYVSLILDGQIEQFNLLAGTGAAIRASAQIVGFGPRMGTLQRGPDNKIYVAANNTLFVDVISNPNVLGAGCAYQSGAVSLAGRLDMNGLPNFPNAFGTNDAVTITASFTGSMGCVGSALPFVGTFTPAVSGAVVTWNFGDPASGSANTATDLTPSHLYATAGTYQVTLTINAPGLATPATSTQTVTIAPLPIVQLGPDVAVCGTQLLLSAGAQPAGTTYRWQDGSTAATYLAQASGIYSVAVTSAAGCTSTATKQVAISPLPIPILPADTTVCGTSVLLRPRGQPAGSTYRWQDGSTAATYLAQANGTYSVTVTSTAGCVGTTSSRVQLGAPPTVSLGPAATVCATNLLLTVGAQPAGTSYRWQDGSTAATYLAQVSGTYSVTVTSAAGCTSTATKQVTLNPAPVVSLPPDILVCTASVLLEPGTQPAGSTYRWQDGSSSATYLAQATGTYTVVVTTPQGCTGTASSRVQLGAVPTVALGADTLVCPNAVWTLRTNPQPAGTLYRWQDGSTAATYLAHGPGQYSVEVRATAAGCPARATRTASGISCPILIPNIITPNGDPQNEFFVLKGLTASEWHLSVYNRWGRQVHDQPHYDNHWNATGEADGLYYYMLTNDTTGERYRGWVEVQRGN